jgi:hypothetical protein
LKLAVTDRASLIVTLQLELPLQAPLQPVKTEPLAGLAVSVTTVSRLKAREQLLPQLMPEGDDVTVPVPVPVLLTERSLVMRAKLAVTDRAALIDTVQFPVPLQAPLQPVKVDPAAGVGVRVTRRPIGCELLQSATQSMPAAAETTRPLPPPATPMLTV